MSMTLLTRDAAWALLTEWTQEREPAQARAGRRSGRARLRAAVRRRRGGLGRRRAAARLRLRAVSDAGGSSVSRLRGAAAARLSGVGDARDPVARRLLAACARESRLEKTLFACDEMAGFVTAAALVRPSKSVLDLEASSVIKRMKDKAFARPSRATTCGAAPRSSDCRSRSTSPTSSRSCASAPTRSVSAERCER